MSPNRERIHTAFWEVNNALESEDLPEAIRPKLMVAMGKLYNAFFELNKIEMEGK